MREHAHTLEVANGPTAPARGARPLLGPALASAIGNRGMNALITRLQASTPPSATSPPNVAAPEDAAIEEGAELTTPDGGTDGGSGSPAPSTWAVAVQNPKSLTIKGSGPIEGAFGISQYWPVTKYWGADKTLGKFDEPSSGGWKMHGHKFQVIGEFTTGTTSATGGGGNVTFKQEARITNTKGGTPGAWFDDMNYTDASGAKHAWDPNTENGSTSASGNPGVRRTISATQYAYTDPPAISYKAGTNTYRKLEFRISLQAPPGASTSTITKTATQEIEVVNGVPNVLQSP
jgi:hypothetical protein